MLPAAELTLTENDNNATPQPRRWPQWLCRVLLLALVVGHFMFLRHYFAPGISTPDATGYYAQAALIANTGRSGFALESPLQMEDLKKRYGRRSGGVVSGKMLEDLIAYAGATRKVYWLGEERAIDRLIPERHGMKVLTTIKLPKPKPDTRSTRRGLGRGADGPPGGVPGGMGRDDRGGRFGRFGGGGFGASGRRRMMDFMGRRRGGGGGPGMGMRTLLSGEPIALVEWTLPSA